MHFLNNCLKQLCYLHSLLVTLLCSLHNLLNSLISLLVSLHCCLN
nr:MAG TPA: hypothetical protein [Bacteriophage sp.]